MSLSRLWRLSCAVVLLAAACSAGAGDGGDASGSGGVVGSGGQSTTGGRGGDAATATGGATSTGGALGTGGTVSTGGAVSTGGTVSTGGAVSTGGRGVTGGSSDRGGAPATGGQVATTGGAGGATSGGGTFGRNPGNAAVPSAGCGRTPSLKNGTITLSSSGMNRQYIIDIPTNYDNNHPYRLYFGYHWAGGTMTDVATGQTVLRNVWAYFGLKQLAQDSTIFVAPQGLNNGWANTNGQDLVFTDDMIKQIEGDLCIDKSRIFAGGFSYGGGMSLALACDRADVFRAVAPQSGSATLSGCKDGTKPMAVFGAAGTETYSAMLSAVQKFAKNNGCTSQSPPQPAAGSKTHICTKYEGCGVGYPVEWCPFDAGHKAAPFDGGCASCDDGNKTWLPKEIWTFFTQF